MHPLPDDAAAPAAPRRRARWRRMVAAALIVGAVGAGAAWWGRPQLGPGGTRALGDGMTWANDGVEDTRMLVRGRPVSTVTARFSIHNNGHRPFTVLGLDPSGWGGTWLSRQQVTFVPGYAGEAAPPTPVERLELGPDDEATVLWSLDLRCQPPLSAGALMEIDELRFAVSWWGIPTTRPVALDKPITFAGDDISRPPPGPECAEG